MKWQLYDLMQWRDGGTWMVIGLPTKSPSNVELVCISNPKGARVVPTKAGDKIPKSLECHYDADKIKNNKEEKIKFIGNLQHIVDAAYEHIWNKE